MRKLILALVLVPSIALAVPFGWLKRVPVCSEGAVTKACKCGTTGRVASGYCYSGSWASAACADGAVSSTCACGAIVSSGYCYGGTAWQDVAQQNESAFVPDANVAWNVFWPNGGLMDTKGNQWTHNSSTGLVQQVTAYTPGGVTTFQSANNYQLGTGVDAGDQAGDFVVCAQWCVLQSANAGLASAGSQTSGYGGWNLLWLGTTAAFDTYDGLGAGKRTTVNLGTGPACGAAGAGVLHVACGGRVGTSQMLKVDGGTTVTQTGAKNSNDSTHGSRIGQQADLNLQMSAAAGYITATYLTASTPTEQLLTALESGAATPAAQPEPCSGTATVTYYASPTGTGNGLTAGTPGSLATVQALARANAAGNNVAIKLAGGTYALASALTLTAPDSGDYGKWICWQAADFGNPPIFSGGVAVTGWTLADEAKNIWSASVTSSSRQLYVNGVRVARARSTNRGFTTSDTGATYVSTDATLPTFARPADLEFVFTPNNWFEDRLIATNVTRVGDTSTATMPYPGGLGVRYPWTGTWPTSPRYIENAYEFLASTTPGWWYLNAGTNTVYYVPKSGESMATADVRLPVLETVLATQATSPIHNVGFQGITFTHTGWTTPTTLGAFLENQANDHLQPPATWAVGAGFYSNSKPPAAVELRGSYNVALRNCTVTHAGGQGVYVGQGARRVVLAGNTITDTSGNGMQIGDTNSVAPGNPTGNVIATQNSVRGIGVEYRGGVGIYVGFTDHVQLLKNEVYDTPYSGITVGWGWESDGSANPFTNGNEVAYNRVHDTNLTLGDGGGIYTQGWHGKITGWQAHTTIHDNYVYNLHVTQFSGDDRTPCLYQDQGTHYVDMTSNVCVAGPNQANWFLENGGNASNTASSNYATAGLARFSSSVNNLTGIDAATAISTDPTAWPAAASAIVAAAGPTAGAGPAIPQVCMLGDSITVGYLSGGPGYPDEIGSFFIGRYHFLGYGVTGDTLAQMKTRYDSWKSTCSVLTLLGGINDIRVSGSDGPTTWTAARAIIDDALGRGIKVVVMTTLPRKGETYVSWTAGQQTAQDYFNNAIKTYSPATHPENYSAVDLWPLFVDPANANQMLPLYDRGDHLHPNQTGQALIAATLANVSGLWP